jgi:hypothetical protein
MPAKQRPRLYYHQGAAPLEPPRQQDQADAGRGVHPAWPHTSLDEQRQLTAQEQILGTHSLRRAEEQHQPPEGVLDQTKCDPAQGDHALIVPHHSILSRQAPLPSTDAILAEDSLLGAGKPKKVALTACARKLLIILNAMVRTRQPFDIARHLA